MTKHLNETTDKLDFLKWLSENSLNPVGASRRELVAISNRWIKHQILSAHVRRVINSQTTIAEVK